MLYTNVLSLSLTHTHTHTHAREHTPMHTQSPKMLSISYVPDTIILFNPYNGVPPWPSHSPWAESLSHSCTTCPLNLCVIHIYPLLHATSLLGPPLCPLGAQGCLLPESLPNLPHPWALPPCFPFDSTYEASARLCASVSQHLPHLSEWAFCRS